MPITKTAKRALRGSKRKGLVNKAVDVNFEKAIRVAKKARDEKSVRKAISLTDRAAKKNLIHKNKASRIKSSLNKLLGKGGPKKPQTKRLPTKTRKA